eukprot:scaffold4271_cov96-Cylindrotheca_fusiformis.AAC.4
MCMQDANILSSLFMVAIFGPSDAAFAAINDTQSGLSKTDILEILLGHVLVGIFDATEVNTVGCEVVETLAETSLQIALYDDWSRRLTLTTVNGILIQTIINGEDSIFFSIDEFILPGSFTPCPPSYIEVARATGNYNTFLNYLTATGIIELLGDRRYTVFGPTDAAFEAAADTLSALNETQLVEILKGHILPYILGTDLFGEYSCHSGDTTAGTEVQILKAQNVDEITINGISVIEPDITGPDGYFQGIDGVILPGSFTPCPPSIYTLAVEAGNYTTLVNAIRSSEVVSQVVTENSPQTTFGPSDEAWAAAGINLTEVAANQTNLVQLIGGHVVREVYTIADAKAAGCMELETIVGTKVKVEYQEDYDHDVAVASHNGTEGTVLVNGNRVATPDLQGLWGIFHGINGVILPGSFSPCSAVEAPEASPVAAPGDSAVPTTAPGDSAASIISTSIAMIAAGAVFAL